MAARHEALRVIAIYKFFKALGLLLLAAAAFGLIHEPFVDGLAQWIQELPIRTGHGLLEQWSSDLIGFGPRNFLFLGIVSLVYASLFATEGIGLWLGKRWAEYLTVIATASLIPIEAWEIYRHVTWVKVLALIVNVAIVIYLWRLLHSKKE